MHRPMNEFGRASINGGDIHIKNGVVAIEEDGSRKYGILVGNSERPGTLSVRFDDECGVRSFSPDRLMTAEFAVDNPEWGKRDQRIGGIEERYLTANLQVSENSP